jgi:hypothetical protein
MTMRDWWAAWACGAMVGVVVTWLVLTGAFWR